MSHFTPRPPAAAPGQRPPRSKAERLALLYDEHIHPLYTRRFDELLIRAVRAAPGAQVLEAGCGAGALTADLVHAFDHDSRIVATDASSALLALARERIGRDHPGRRVFFRAQANDRPLPFSDNHFDVVISNLVLDDQVDPLATLDDLVRVCKPGGQFVMATALRGTWIEFLDLLREALVRRWDVQALAALDTYEAKLFEGEALARALEERGITAVDVRLQRWELLFQSAREFFFAPVIDHGPLRRWKAIAGRGPSLQAVFNEVKRSIDAYFANRAFPVSVVAGCLHGRKGQS